MTTPLLDALDVRALVAYQTRDGSAPAGLRLLGAALDLHGIAVNGGLVGGGVENLLAAGERRAVDDAVEGFRWLGLVDVAALVARARDEYLRFRPSGREELGAEDEELWERLDAEFFEIATAGRIEAAVSARLQEIAPGHGSH